MLNQTAPSDYIISTGKSHTLLKFVETAFRLVGKDWQDYVTIDEALMRPADILRNKVDPSKAFIGLGWKAKSSMVDVVAMMLEAEMASIRKDEVA